ncbi:hypothetical protein WJX73_002253 [Symbiochloris irregularis]|uniref:Kinetochore protein Nuf2 n=1 Tax=Symbiochloris irregularis TaxID=706552 RepID=A0AAW1PJP7_9CHLO
MSQSYSFPVLSDQELVPWLREFDMPLTAAQLAKPTYELVKPVFEIAVAALVGVTREELQQPVFAATDVLEYPELHDESIPFMAFMSSLFKLFRAAGIKDFTLQDVCKPEAPRLRRQLSAIVNFARHREHKVAFWVDAAEQAAQAQEEAAEMQDAKAAVEAELKRLLDERAAQQPEVQALEAAHQDMYAENRQLSKQQQAAVEELARAKEASNRVEEEISSDRLRLKQAQLEGAQLRSQVIESPEKLQRKLEELSAAMEKERGLTVEAEKRMRDVQARLDAIARVERELGKAGAAVEEVGTEVGRKKEASRRVKALRGELGAVLNDMEEVEAQLRTLRAKSERLSLWTSQHQHQSQLRQEAAALAIEQRLKEREAIEASNAAQLAKLAENEGMVRSLSEKLRQVQSKHSREVAAVVEQYNALQAQVTDYHTHLFAAMASVEAC